MQRIEKIKAISKNEFFQHSGDLHIEGNVGCGAWIEITDGNLTIAGDVGDRAHIELKQNTKLAINSSQATSSTANLSFGLSFKNKINIKGNVGVAVKISADRADVLVAGKISANSEIKIKHGNIMALEVGKNTILATSGDIQVATIASSAVIHKIDDNENVSIPILVEDDSSVTIENGVLIFKFNCSADFHKATNVISKQKITSAIFHVGEIFDFDGFLVFLSKINHQSSLLRLEIKSDDLTVNELTAIVNSLPHKTSLTAIVALPEKMLPNYKLSVNDDASSILFCHSVYEALQINLRSRGIDLSGENYPAPVQANARGGRVGIVSWGR